MPDLPSRSTFAPGHRRKFYIIAVVFLGFGLGIDIAAFSVFNAVLLKPLPYPAPQRLVQVWETETSPSDRFPVTAQDYLVWSRESSTFDQIAAIDYGSSLAILSGSGPEQVRAAGVTTNFLGVFGVKPIDGRGFTPDDASSSTALLSYRLAEALFGRDTHVEGRSIELNGRHFRVIGVMPEVFRFPEWADLWIPLSLREDQLPERGTHYLQAVGRLKPGFGIRQANAELATIAGRLERQFPESNKGVGVHLVGLHDQLVTAVKPFVVLLAVVATLVLFLSCANVAYLLLARAIEQRGDIAVRLALGARGIHLFRKYVRESLFVCSTGGLLGFWIAYVASILLQRIALPLKTGLESRMDNSVLLFTAIAVLLTGLAIAIPPARQAADTDVNAILKETTGGDYLPRSSRRRQRVLVICEIALAQLTLILAFSFLLTFHRLMELNPGFDPDGVLTVSIDLPPDKYPQAANRIAFYNSLFDELRRDTSVKSVGMTNFSPPLAPGPGSFQLANEGSTWAATTGTGTIVQYRVIGGDYFQAMQIPLLRGRYFSIEDASGKGSAAIVNDTMAKEFWGLENTIGQRIRVGQSAESWVRVVGIVGTVKETDLAEPPAPEIYFYYPQAASPSMIVMVRSMRPPSDMVKIVKSAIRDIDPLQPVHDVETMDTLVNETLSKRRFSTLVLVIFASLALLLAIGGTYGLTAHEIESRQRELSIRVAVGASRAHLTKLLISGLLRLTAIGLLVGSILGYFCGILLSSQFHGLESPNPFDLLFSGVVLLVAVSTSTFVCARRFIGSGDPAVERAVSYGNLD